MEGNKSTVIIYNPEHSAKINNMCKHQTKQDLQTSLHKTNAKKKATDDNIYPGMLKSFMDSFAFGAWMV